MKTRKGLIAAVCVTVLFSSAVSATQVMASTVPAATDHSLQGFTAIGNNIIASGSKYLGTPYLLGANPSQTKNFDCSSFTYRAFIENGINLPRTANAQYGLGISVSLDKAVPGDLIFYRDTQFPNEAGHVSIYMGNGKMLHAASSGKGVSVADVNNSYWKQRFMGVKRVVPTIHTVQPGDTLWRISLSRGATVQELRNWNKLRTDNLSVGQHLFTTNPDLLMSQTFSVGRSHLVQPGDTLWLISRAAGVSIEDIRIWNGLSNDQIHVGQRLRLEASFKTYRVVAGDTIWGISQKTRTPEAAIRRANSLTNDNLQINQILQIPVSF